jgi:hypothetical protein
VFDKRLVIVWTSRKITDFVVISPFFIAIGLKTNLLPSVTETTQKLLCSIAYRLRGACGCLRVSKGSQIILVETAADVVVPAAFAAEYYTADIAIHLVLCRRLR